MAETVELLPVQAKPKGSWRAPVSRSRLILVSILIVQTALSLRLIWSNTAFPDEALYLWAGHMEWAHWLHGTPLPSPAFPTYFSGAPVVYPPLGALVDAYGGLAGARLLSLAFMLGATALLYDTAQLFFGKRAALFSTGLFVGLAAVQYLGAFATYDAMALFLLALACWLGSRAVAADRLTVRLILMAICGAVLAVAGAAKYAAGLFIPVVLAAVILCAWWRRGRLGAVSGLIASTTFCMALGVLLAAGGRSYWQGIAYTTLARQQGTYLARFLLYASGKWTGVLVLFAIIGAVSIAAVHRGWQPAAYGAVLAGASFLVPAEQARIHTYTSLFKHLAFGGWFAAIPAGVSLAALARSVPMHKAMAALRVAVVAVVLAAVPSLSWAQTHYGWPDTAKVLPTVARTIKDEPGPVLTDDRGNVLDYYYPSLMRRRIVDGTFFFPFNNSHGVYLTGRRAYAAAIGQRYFSVIFLEFWDSAQADNWIVADIARDGGYRLVSLLSYPATGTHGRAMIWVRSSR